MYVPFVEGGVLFIFIFIFLLLFRGESVFNLKWPKPEAFSFYGSLVCLFFISHQKCLPPFQKDRYGPDAPLAFITITLNKTG